MLIDFGIIFVLIAINGFFSSSEIAVISLKKSRLNSLAESGNKRAILLQRIKADPDHFFATVQIGVTLVGIIASAYGGSRLMMHLDPVIKQNADLAYIGPYLNEISFAMFVFFIAYMTLIFGELVPKSIALSNAEKVALLVAYPLSFFSKVFYSFTFLLTISSNIILKPFRDSTSFSEGRFQEEEIKQLLKEGVDAGTINKNEHTLIENVFEINDTSVREIMEPRPQIRGIDLEASTDDLLELIVDLPFSRLPVYEGNIDHITGILHTRDFMREIAIGNKQPDLKKLISPAYVIPETMKIDHLLKDLQARKLHMAIIVDEYGITAGIITMEDILDEIVGGLAGTIEAGDEDYPVRIGPETFRVAGLCTVDDFNSYFKSEIEENPPQIIESEAYNSIAGFVIASMGRFPEVGELLKFSNFTINLTRRVRNQLVQFTIELVPEIKELSHTEENTEKDSSKGRRIKSLTKKSSKLIENNEES